MAKRTLEQKSQKKMYKIQKYMTMHDKMKSVRIGEYEYDTAE